MVALTVVPPSHNIYVVTQWDNRKLHDAELQSRQLVH